MKICYDQGYNDVGAMKWEPLIIQGYCLQVSYFRAQ